MVRTPPSEPQLEIGSTQFMLLLQSLPQVGEKALTRLLAGAALRRFTPEAILCMSAEELQRELELDARAAAYLAANRASLVQQSAELARNIRSYPVQLLAFSGAAYPSRIDRYASIPPPLVYAVGNLQLLDESTSNGAAPGVTSPFTFTIAVSRSAAQGTLVKLDELGTELVIAGGVPVTGHERAEYQRLALSAQRRNAPTIYVFDRGLREALGPEFNLPPFAAARIRDVEFELKRDLALSQFRLTDHCLGGNNRKRDSLIFSLSDVVIALDVAPNGAMYAECLRAYRQGKKVFVSATGRDGNRALIDNGVPLLPAAIVREEL